MNAVEVKELTKKFKGFTLDHVSFSLPAGCIMGLVGENGAGKSTTLKLLLNMIQKDSGRITILGKDEKNIDKNEIGVVFDECRFHESFTAKDINQVLKSIFQRWNEQQFFDYLNRFEVPSNKKLKEFSRGMKMKISIAAAVSHDAKLLLLDEPTSTLDPVVRDEMLDIFYDFISDEAHSIIISSHIVSDLEKVCDYIAFMHKGKMILCEEKDRLLQECRLAQMSEAEFSAIDKDEIIGSRKTPFGITAVIRKAAAAQIRNTQPINLEDLFVYMIRGEEK
ncbi:MAG TPA: ABC transporter ATP-binding protein [Candidatus Eubacterium faecipullorum]|uniref:ABC transporter ATP-binding protein n=1 Tax=Candidatus Eubacterium faecipullorum TaxID=2838571 RepID=A0A9D1REQ2_9FIRM|nr:ABC transporter ATP-binding protein [Candidatus Eubacterium faecipullorum]